LKSRENKKRKIQKTIRSPTKRRKRRKNKPNCPRRSRIPLRLSAKRLTIMERITLKR